MRSVSQLAYLQALDIPALVSRQNLPGAARTRRLQLSRSSPAAPADSTLAAAPAGKRAPELAALTAGLRSKSEAPAAVVEPAGEAAPDDSVAGNPAAVDTAAVDTAAVDTAAVDTVAGTPVFSVAATLAGGWFWLDEIPAGREPGDDYGQLLLAICRALGWSQEPARLERFAYPVAAGLAGGVEEARQALLGFLSGRLSRLTPTGVILMGDMDQPWFDRDCLAEQRVVHTVSAWRMLREPALKPQAWADLKSLRGDG
jgi:hypothetical protein